MTPLLAALALLLQDQPAQAAAPPAPAAAEAESQVRIPQGAPQEPYQFVSWCYGMLRGYLELHDEMMPEVTRIESAFRKPGTKLADDLKVYADQQAQGRNDLELFQRAMTAAERASLRPINALGAQAVRRGRAQWNFPPEYTKATRAQAWMGWTLPAACQTVAADLEKRALLMGATFQVNAEPDPALSEPVVPIGGAPAAASNEQADPAAQPAQGEAPAAETAAQGAQAQ